MANGAKQRAYAERLKLKTGYDSQLGRSTVQRPDDLRRPYEPNQQVRDFQPYGVGKPIYNGGRSVPNLGPVSGREGYRERDLTTQAYKKRMMSMIKAKGL